MVLKSRVRAPDWSANGNPDHEAKCRKHPLPVNHDVNADTDPFFFDEEEARHICNGTYDNKLCPFRDQCLFIALVNNEGSGTFGGLTTPQRRWVRAQRDPFPGHTLIHRDDWDNPMLWLHLVPSPEELAEEEADDGEG